MTAMDAARSILPATTGLAAGAGLALLAPPEGVALWVEHWLIGPFAQLVYLGISCF
jgi:hypothetical protein